MYFGLYWFYDISKSAMQPRPRATPFKIQFTALSGYKRKPCYIYGENVL